MPLTDTAVRTAKARPKPYKLFDFDGLYLLVNPSGSKWWRFKYQFGGREKLLSLGVYDDVSLKDARAARDAARKLVAAKVNPSDARQRAREGEGATLERVAREWLAKQRHHEPKTAERIKRRFETGVFGFIGREPIATVTSASILALLRRIEARGRHDTAHRTRAELGRVFRFAVATGRAERDPTADLKGALEPVKTTHFAAVIEPKKVGELLRAIDGFNGHLATEFALRLAPYVFVRPGELRAAEWAEFDFEAAEWRIPAERMKMERPHLVPLATQTIKLLDDLKPHTGTGRLLFPTLKDPQRPMSDNTLNAALRRLGYTKAQMTAHGFRTMASTILNEQGFHPDLIELQLAHKEKNDVRGAYNRAERIKERRAMMQSYADYLDGLKSGAKVLAINRIRK